MKLLAPFVALLAALAVVIHLDDAPPRADLVFVNRGEIFTLDPQRMSWMQDFRMARGPGPVEQRRLQRRARRRLGVGRQQRRADLHLHPPGRRAVVQRRPRDRP
ncbi:MAG: hypothetical protein ACYS15_14895 [Planctomycetota bacterium]|jgi:hypothetical protein